LVFLNSFLSEEFDWFNAEVTGPVAVKQEVHVDFNSDTGFTVRASPLLLTFPSSCPSSLPSCPYLPSSLLLTPPSSLLSLTSFQGLPSEWQAELLTQGFDPASPTWKYDKPVVIDVMKFMDKARAAAPGANSEMNILCHFCKNTDPKVKCKCAEIEEEEGRSPGKDGGSSKLQRDPKTWSIDFFLNKKDKPEDIYTNFKKCGEG
jgi:hypothetical protein